jgi:hypothetical protein
MNNFFQKYQTAPARHLGDFVLEFPTLLDSKKFIKICDNPDFKKKTLHEKYSLFFHALIEDIQSISGSCFLFPELVRLFESLDKAKLLPQVHFAYFELWLNQFSQVSGEDNYKIRAKICGKYLPRDLYQLYFPCGQNKSFFGAHFVTAHSSPDLDTTVASFWGWLDAFACRIGEGLHHWNVPGGAPNYQVEFKLIFDDIFSSYLFPLAAKHRGALQITALELLTQKGVLKKSIESSSLSIDLEKNSEAIVLVDNDGYFHGDWKTVDVEGVRQVVMLVNQVLRHFENALQQDLIALFAKQDLKKDALLSCIKTLISQSFVDVEPLKDISDRQRKHVTDYLKEVLHVKKGLDANIEDLAEGLYLLKIDSFKNFIEILKGHAIQELFDASGSLKASREELFKTLDVIISALDEAIHSLRHFVDKLKVALDIKTKVFGYKPQHVSEKADVDELRTKMGNSSYLTVTLTDEKGLIPIGVIYAQDLYKPLLGTCTLRDFSNREETKVPNYLEVISVIDHHKSQLSGTVPATIYISDAQSSNVMTGDLAFRINDEYSTSGMTKDSIINQLKKIDVLTASSSQKRIYKKLLSKLEALDKRGSYSIDPIREYLEYQHFLYAILDDTDMLSKVTRKDVETVKDLINRMKTMLLGEEVEVVHFDDISEGPEFTQTAASRLLRNADLCSITQKIYKHKEIFIEEIIKKAAVNNDLLFFADTKEQNGCCRIGQFKMYPVNYPVYQDYSQKLQNAFIEESNKVSVRKKEVDLHIYMISTLAGLEGTFEKKQNAASHLDEVWLYIPEGSEGGLAHLRAFLNSFGSSSGALKAVKSISLINGSNEVKELLEDTIMATLKVPFEAKKEPLKGQLVVLHVAIGSMNSRKAMITPYLPKLVL